MVYYVGLEMSINCEILILYDLYSLLERNLLLECKRYLIYLTLKLINISDIIKLVYISLSKDIFSVKNISYTCYLVISL